MAKSKDDEDGYMPFIFSLKDDIAEIKRSVLATESVVKGQPYVESVNAITNASLQVVNSVTSVNNGIGEVKSTLNGVNANVDEVKTKVTELNPLLNTSASDIRTISNGISDMNTVIGETIGTLEALYSQVGTSTQSIENSALSLSSDSGKITKAAKDIVDGAFGLDTRIATLGTNLAVLQSYISNLSDVAAAKSALVAVTESAQMVVASLATSAESLMAVYHDAVDDIGRAASSTVSLKLDAALSAVSSGVGSLMDAASRVTTIATGIASLSETTGTANVELTRNIALANSIVAKLSAVLGAVATNDVSLREVMVKLEHVNKYMDSMASTHEVDRLIDRVTKVTAAISATADTAMNGVVVSRTKPKEGASNDYLK